MKKKHLHIVVFLLSGTFFSVCAESATTLRQAITAAYANNPAFAAKRHELKASEAARLSALSEFLPSVLLQASSSYQQIKDQQNPPHSNLGSKAFEESVALEQSLFSGGGSVARFRQTEASISASEAGFFANEQKLISDTIESYVDLWAKEANLKVSQRAEQIYKETFASVEEKVKYGVASKVDLAKSKAEYSRISARLEKAQSDVTGAVSKFEKMTGLKYEGIEAPTFIAKIPGTEDEVVAAALARNPSLAQVGRQVDVANHAHTAAISGFLPSAKMTASVGGKRRRDTTVDTDINSPQKTTTLNRSVGFSVSMPIFQGGKEYASLKETSQKLEASKKNLRAGQQDLLQAINAGWADWKSAGEQVRRYEDGVEAAQFVRDGMRDEYNFGIKSLYEVYQEEQNFLNAEYSLVEAQKNQLLYAYQLSTLMGELTASSLKLAEGGAEAGAGSDAAPRPADADKKTGAATIVSSEMGPASVAPLPSS